jgi:HK97 family phage major capsid protein/HK97 family phage prohead protease
LKLDDLAPARLPFPVTRAAAMPVEAQAADTGMPTMTGHFATFNDWYEVDSLFEGHFLESVDPRAFDQTIAESRDSMKVLFDHGQDPHIGNKILGQIESLSTDETGPAYSVPLFDTSYNRDLAPGLEAGAYGSSFRFQVDEDTWQRSPTASEYNPDALPERTITRASVMEFGPVTFPANPNARAGTRSTTDDYYKRSRDSEGLDALMRSAQAARSPKPAPQPAAPAPKGTPVEDKYVTRAEKAARRDELQEQLTRMAGEYPGVMPETAQAEWDAADAEQRALIADIQAWDARTARLKVADEGNRGVETTAPTLIFRKSEEDVYDLDQYGPGHVRSLDERNQKLRDNAMRSVETSRMDHPNTKPDAVKEHIQRMIDEKDAPTRDNPNRELAQRILHTGAPIYRNLFNKVVKAGDKSTLTPEEFRYAALQVVGTTTTGGYAIPYTFDPTFIPTGAYTNINPFRAICRVEQIVGSNNWQGVSVGAVLAAFDGESAATTEGGPTFARPSLTAQRVSSFVTLSRETLADRPDIGTELGVLINEAKDTLEENQFSIGVGTTVYPLGAFVEDTFTPKSTITSQVFAVADLDATEAALPIRYRRDAVWMLSRAVIRIIQGFETVNGKLFNATSTAGYPAVGNIENTPTGNTGMQLLGYPVWETPSAPSTVTSADTTVGLLVSPKHYMILDRVGMEVEIVPNMFDATTGFPNGNRGLLAIWRTTGKSLVADAGRQISILE